MPNEPRRQVADLWTTCAEPQYRGAQRFSVAFSVIPSAITTTTFTTAVLTQNDWVGCYVVPQDGNARGQLRQIKSVNTSTGVATIDAAWNSITSTTVVQIWVPPDVPIWTSSVGVDPEGTTAVASAHASITNEPDDYWNDKGYFLLFAGGANAGKAAKVTDFATSTGKFVFTPAVTSTTAGQLAYLRAVVRPEGQVTAKVTPKTLARTLIGHGDPDAPVHITNEGSVAYELPVRTVTAAGSSTAATGQPDLRDLLTDVFTEDLDTGTTTTSMSGTSLTVGSGSNFSTGGFVLVNNGQAGHIRSISSNVLTIGTSHITASQVSGSTTAYASAWYQRKASDFRTRTFDGWRGGKFRQLFHGCMPTVKLMIGRDQVVRFGFSYTAGEAYEYNVDRPVAVGAATPITLVDTTVPIDGKAARCLIGGTNVLMGDIEIDCGFSPKPRPALSNLNQIDGHAMDLGPITGTATLLADEDDVSGFKSLVDRLRAGDTIDLFYQKGVTAGQVFCFAMPAMHLTSNEFDYQDAQGVFSFAFTAVKPQAARGNSFDSALPAFSFGQL